MGEIALSKKQCISFLVVLPRGRGGEEELKQVR